MREYREAARTAEEEKAEREAVQWVEPPRQRQVAHTVLCTDCSVACRTRSGGPSRGSAGRTWPGRPWRERHYNVRPRRRQETANIAKFYAFKNDSSSADSEEEEDEIRDIHKQKQEVQKDIYLVSTRNHYYVLGHLLERPATEDEKEGHSVDLAGADTGDHDDHGRGGGDGGDGGGDSYAAEGGSLHRPRRSRSSPPQPSCGGRL